MSMQKYIDILSEGAMMDEGGSTFVFAQDWTSADNAVQITVRAYDSSEAHTKFQEVKAEAEMLGVQFPDSEWEIISSY